MDYIKINGNAIPCPNDFAMTRESVLASSMQTMSGKVIADVIGWKYSDVTLAWGTLYEGELQTLLAETNPLNGTFQLTFNEAERGEITVEAMRTSRVMTKTRFTVDGNALWQDIQVSLTFPNCHR